MTAPTSVDTPQTPRHQPQHLVGMLHLNITNPGRPVAEYACYRCGRTISATGVRDFAARAAGLRTRHHNACPAHPNRETQA